MGELRGGASPECMGGGGPANTAVAPSDDFITDALIITPSLAGRHGCSSLMRAGNQRKSR